MGLDQMFDGGTKRDVIWLERYLKKLKKTYTEKIVNTKIESQILTQIIYCN